MYNFDFDWTGSFTQIILPFLQTIVWPAVVCFTLYLFKDIFQYLFLSMRSFNFLGAKGELRPVQDVIDEQVMKKFESEKSGAETQRISAELQNTSKTVDEYKIIALDYIEKNAKLEEELNSLRFPRTSTVADDLQAQITALMKQIAQLQVSQLKDN